MGGGLQHGRGQMFIRGTLVENRPGATYKGVVYDRSLRLVLDSGIEVHILDDSYPSLPISTNVQLGGYYEFLVMAAVGTSTTCSPTALHQPLHNWGIILDLHWQPPPNPANYYRWHGPRLYHNAGGFVQVETSIGHLYFGPDEIWRHPTVRSGWYVYWQQTRLELLAIR